MDAASRHDRTLRLLEARLEALAFASARAPISGRRFERQIVAAGAATRHAVALELITSEEAGALWAGVASRYPAAAWCQAGPGLAA
jgi:hypothetical protein